MSDVALAPGAPTPSPQVAAEAAQAEAQNTIFEAQKVLVASAAGLPPELAELLKGGTKEELEAHAASLKAVVKSASEMLADPTASADGGTRREEPTWTVDAVRKLAKEDPVKFNAMVESGQIDLGRIA